MNFSDSIESPVKFDHIFSPLASGLKMTIKELVMRERERTFIYSDTKIQTDRAECGNNNWL